MNFVDFQLPTPKVQDIASSWIGNWELKLGGWELAVRELVVGIKEFGKFRVGRVGSWELVIGS